MLYIVEMALHPGHTDRDWEQWQSDMKSAELLMTVPGFLSAQRFKGLSDPLAYCAIYSLAAADVMTGPAYRAVGGGVRVQHWNSHIAYWHRDTVDGVAIAPNVPQGYVLLVRNASALDFPAAELPFIRLTTIGLNKTVPYRGIAIVPAGKTGCGIAEASDIRVYRPIAPQLLAATSALS